MSKPGMLVTGGTGKTSGRVVRRLKELGWPVRLASPRGAPPRESRACASTGTNRRVTRARWTAWSASSYGEAAAIIGDALGRPVRHVNLSEEALAERWSRLGLRQDYAALLASMDGAIARGAEDRTTATVEQVTGQPPRDLADFARASVSAWRK
ncbi:hypothetical protein F0U60_37055 [Archangium minus]|uniref:Uncharacterized protein n=1 Tax=Archangium minus TaxID=83450 RepID=A0ABY9X124_9BACT|nr:hypothetical protein F0U60_37055 [Archangium minus]